MQRRTVQIADVQGLDLAALCTFIAERYTKDKTAISGAAFAHLAKCLMAAEQKPGGPYLNAQGMPTVTINAAVGRLFVLMGKPLPLVDAYIAKVDAKTLSPAEKQAIKKYRSAKLPKHAHGKSQRNEPYALAQTTLQQLSEPLRSQALAFLQRVASADTTSEIALIAAHTARALNAQIPLATLHRLGEANIYGWIAYMIYDHIIDGETTPQLLPVANVTMRLAFSRYQALFPPNHPLQQLIRFYFDQVDEANAWELAHCRFKVSHSKLLVGQMPDYAQYDLLAQRSGIHILGPLAVAHLSPLGQQPQKIEQLTAGLRQYLIARQLSDDIHDWKEDLAAGHISPVVTQLLKNNKNAVQESQNLEQLTHNLQHDFFRRSMRRVNNDITEHANQSGDFLRQAGCKKGSALLGLVTRLTHMANASLSERSRLLEFGQVFKQA